MTFLSTLITQGLGNQNPLDAGVGIGIEGASKAFNPNLSAAGAAAGGQPLVLFLSIFLGFFTVLGGLMFLIYFIFAALTWITGGGDKGKIESAKTQMTNGAIGLTIVIVSQAIIGIVGGVLGVNILQPITLLDSLWAL